MRGLTRERGRQILIRVGGPSAKSVRQTQQMARQDQLTDDRGAIARDLASHPNSNLSEVAERLGLSPERVKECLTPALRSLVDTGNRRPSGSRWSTDDVLGILRAAAVIHGVEDGSGPLTGPMYHEVRADLEGPSIPRIWQMFGSWGSAIKAAGLLARESGRSTSTRFTDQQLLDFVVQYLLDPTADGRSFAGYDRWRRNNAPHGPSGALLRNRLGRWQDVRAQAWTQAVSTGAVTSADLLATSHVAMDDLDDDQLWAADEVLRSVETDGGNPGNPAEYDSRLVPGAPSAETLTNSFGTWGLALGALGWDPTSLTRTAQRQSSEEALGHLREFVQPFVAQHGRPPTTGEWQRARDTKTTLGPWAYVRQHGSWEEALDAVLQRLA